MEILFDTKLLAETTSTALKDIIDNDGYVTVEDVNDMCGLKSNVNDRSIGWKTTSGIEVVKRTGDKYGLFLPEPQKLWPTKDDPTESTDVMVDHPSHYQSESGLEAIDVIEAFTADLKGYEAVDTANTLKYMLRWKKKNGLQDLKKARWYLNRLITNIQKGRE